LLILAVLLLSFRFTYNLFYAKIQGPFELRLHGFPGQQAGREVLLFGFRLEGRVKD